MRGRRNRAVPEKIFPRSEIYSAGFAKLGGTTTGTFAWPMIPRTETISISVDRGEVMLSNSNVTSAHHYHSAHVYARRDCVLCVRSQRTPDTFEHASRVCSFCSVIIHAWCSYCTPLALRLALTLWVFIMHRHRRPFAVIAGDFDDRPSRHLECSWQIQRLLRFRWPSRSTCSRTGCLKRPFLLIGLTSIYIIKRLSKGVTFAEIQLRRRIVGIRKTVTAAKLRKGERRLFKVLVEIYCPPPFLPSSHSIERNVSFFFARVALNIFRILEIKM